MAWSFNLQAIVLNGPHAIEQSSACRLIAMYYKLPCSELPPKLPPWNPCCLCFSIFHDLNFAEAEIYTWTRSWNLKDLEIYLPIQYETICA
jgi:hypothetical protein